MRSGGDGLPWGATSHGALVARSFMSHEDPFIGRRLGGKYEITGLLGRGGFGAVYRGVQAPVNRPVAVKVISANQGKQTALNLKERFFREAELVSKLRSTAVVNLYDYGAEADGLLYMVLEFIEGPELQEIILREAPMAPERIGHLGTQMLEGLVEAHSLGIIHRDLKPANVMVVRDALGREQAKVLDFGIAKVLSNDLTQANDLATKSGIALGTPAYMAPEQAFGRNIGPWSDQYAIGAMLYRMAAGQLPFEAPSAFEVLSRKNREKAPPFAASLEIPPGLEAVIFQALEIRPADRFPSTAEMAQALIAAHRDIIGVTGPLKPVAAHRSTASGPVERHTVLMNEETSAPTVLLDSAPISLESAALDPLDLPSGRGTVAFDNSADAATSDVAAALPSDALSLSAPATGSRGLWRLVAGVIGVVVVGAFLLYGGGPDEAPGADTVKSAGSPGPSVHVIPAPVPEPAESTRSRDAPSVTDTPPSTPTGPPPPASTLSPGAAAFAGAVKAAKAGDRTAAFRFLGQARAAKMPKLWEAIRGEAAFAGLMKDQRMKAYGPAVRPSPRRSPRSRAQANGSPPPKPAMAATPTDEDAPSTAAKATAAGAKPEKPKEAEKPQKPKKPKKAEDDVWFDDEG